MSGVVTVSAALAPEGPRGARRAGLGVGGRSGAVCRAVGGSAVLGAAEHDAAALGEGETGHEVIVEQAVGGDSDGQRRVAAVCEAATCLAGGWFCCGLGPWLSPAWPGGAAGPKNRRRQLCGACATTRTEMKKTQAAVCSRRLPRPGCPGPATCPTTRVPVARRRHASPCARRRGPRHRPRKRPRGWPWPMWSRARGLSRASTRPRNGRPACSATVGLGAAPWEAPGGRAAAPPRRGCTTWTT